MNKYPPFRPDGKIYYGTRSWVELEAASRRLSLELMDAEICNLIINLGENLVACRHLPRRFSRLKNVQKFEVAVKGELKELLLPVWHPEHRHFHVLKGLLWPRWWEFPNRLALLVDGDIGEEELWRSVPRA